MRLEFIRFLIVGGANFFLTLSIFYLLVELLSVHYVVSLFLVSIIGWIFTYVFNFVWTFRPEVRLTFGARLVKYVATGFVSVSANAIALHALVTWTAIPAFQVQLWLVPFVIAVNFLAAKFWSLNRTRA